MARWWRHWRAIAAADPWIGRATVRISADIVAMPIERERAPKVQR